MPLPYNEMPVRGLAADGLVFMKNSDEICKKGSSEKICKSGWREIFCQAEVWETQEYFVYFKFPKPMDRRKISVIHRSGFIQSFP